jgi:acylglycerol lipase
MLKRTKPMLQGKEFISYDGKRMAWSHWPVVQGRSCKAVVIAIHGLSGAASDFWLLGEKLPQQNIAVYAYELRGQGNDSELNRRGDVLSSIQWRRDLQTFHRLVKARHPDVPIFWYGESLGSLIALHTAAESRGRDSPQALILSAPLAGLRQQLGSAEHFLLTAASHLMPFVKVSLGQLAHMDEDKMRVTTTSTHGGQMQQSPHHVPAFTLRLLRETGRMIDSNPQAADDVRIPSLWLASPHDIVAGPEQIQSLFAKLEAKDKKLLWYTRSYHLLLHDVQRDEVLRDVLRFIEKHQEPVQRLKR